MKKIVSIILVLVAVLTVSVNAFAATKKEVLDALSEPIITDYWETRDIPDEYINAAEKHLDKANFSSAELDTILGYIEQGRYLIEKEYAEIYYSKLTKAQQKELVDLMNKAAKAAKVEVKVKDNAVYFKSLITEEMVGGDITKPIQNTGADMTALVFATSALAFAAVAGTVAACKLGKRR